jgi:hypothetical protein
MSRTKEMKLHHCKRKHLITGATLNVEYFYDTHIRLWTAYVRDDEGNAGSCGYGRSAYYAISELECIDNEGE